MRLRCTALAQKGAIIGEEHGIIVASICTKQLTAAGTSGVFVQTKCRETGARNTRAVRDRQAQRTAIHNG